MNNLCTMEIRELLLPGSTYHICTRSNGDDQLFREHDDYIYFKESFQKKLSQAWEILAWVLLPNELHLVIRIKEVDTKKPVSHSHLFGNVLNGYVQHYNRRYFRQGSLLNRSFRRELIKSESQLKDLICRMDNLPVAQHLVTDPEDWKFGSYSEFQKSNYISHAAQTIVEKFTDIVSYVSHHLRDGMMRANILPPRKWLNRWFSFDDPDPSGAGGNDPPFG